MGNVGRTGRDTEKLGAMLTDADTDADADADADKTIEAA